MQIGMDLVLMYFYILLIPDQYKLDIQKQDSSRTGFFMYTQFWVGFIARLRPSATANVISGHVSANVHQIPTEV